MQDGLRRQPQQVHRVPEYGSRGLGSTHLARNDDYLQSSRASFSRSNNGRSRSSQFEITPSLRPRAVSASSVGQHILEDAPGIW